MADHLLDTGILIRHLRNRPGYRELVGRLADEGQLYIASFTRLEVVRGMRDHEREATFALLDALRTHPLDAKTADQAGEMIRTWRQKGITISGPDAVVAASALLMYLIVSHDYRLSYVYAYSDNLLPTHYLIYLPITLLTEDWQRAANYFYAFNILGLAILIPQPFHPDLGGISIKSIFT